MRSPILFLVFNRPDTTRLVFERIRAARPKKLYVAADGPRAARAGEAQRCQEVRAIASGVDWPCEVSVLFREANLGCKKGVSSGIDWFFHHEPEGIVLEDDVLPVASFFDFCDQLLERYREDARVAMVTGSNLVSSHFTAQESYFFSRYAHIWGWAGWRRAWRYYDVAMTEWPAWRDDRGLQRISGGKRLVDRYWRRILDRTYNGMIDTWDYQWFFACWRIPGLTIVPAANQTTNLGYGIDATHTTANVPEFVRSSVARPLQFPLTHPESVAAEPRADALIDSKVFGINVINTLKHFVRDMPLLRNSSLISP